MKHSEKNKIIFLLITAIGIMLFCTKSSPLYSFNDWGDANIYFTMGKGIFRGQIPYRDLYDHKGPLIYFLYGIAGLISEKSFLGVWFLEILAAFIFLLYAYKTAILLCEESVIKFMPVFAAVVYASNHMRHGGSAEELCLPFLAYGLYLSTKYFTGEKSFADRELFFLGVTSGCVLWTKYTMLGFYLGWIAVPACYMIWKKEWKQLMHTFMYIVLGVFSISVPILLYFLLNGALTDLLNVYFYNNIFLYAGESRSMIELLYGTMWNVIRAAGKNFLIFAFIAIGIIGLGTKKKWFLLAQLILCALGMTLSVLTAQTVHGYYSMCFSVLGIFGVSILWIMLSKCAFSEGRLVAMFSLIFMAIFSCLCGYNREFLLRKKSGMPQYQFAEFINSSSAPTLLNYGFLDGGFYTVSGVNPSNKYFFEANMNLEEMKEEQKTMVDNGEVEFIVTFDEVYHWSNYKRIAEANIVYEGNPVTYYLYQRKD